MDTILRDYLRCPDEFFQNIRRIVSVDAGSTRPGEGLTCNRQSDSAWSLLPEINRRMMDVGPCPSVDGKQMDLACDSSQLIDSLRLERYRTAAKVTHRGMLDGNAARRIYYS